MQQLTRVFCGLLFCLQFVSCTEKQQSRALCQLSMVLDEEAVLPQCKRETVAEGDPPLTPWCCSQGGEGQCLYATIHSRSSMEPTAIRSVHYNPRLIFATVKMSPHRESFVLTTVRQWFISCFSSGEKNEELWVLPKPDRLVFKHAMRKSVLSTTSQYIYIIKRCLGVKQSNFKS